jgi:RNA polymerase sigma factor (TIGR02999 family)
MRSSAASRGMPDGQDGASPARDQLPTKVYAELRRIAQRVMQSEPSGHTLQPTALVHEAFLRMAGHEGMEKLGPTHLRALFAQAMHRILVDHARRKRAHKRGGERVRVSLDEKLLSDSAEQDLLDLEEILQELATLDPNQARLVELRVFGGMTVAEAAAEMGLSKRTAEREWTAARAWLRRELDPADAHDS